MSRIDAIIDGSALFARSFFAGQRHESDAILAGLRSTLGVIHHTRSTHIVFCWDGKRKSVKPRGPKPEGYDDERQRFQETVSWLLGVPQIISEEHEADDLVATIVDLPTEADELYVVSSDKDLQQLQGCRLDIPVHYYDLNSKAALTRSMILEKWPVKKPSQIAIALAIIGDKGDGILGIHGWGPKKVKVLFKEVDQKMNFQQAFEAVEAQIPEDKLQSFYDSLEATILHRDALVQAMPAEIVWRSPEELDEMNLGELAEQYSFLYSSRRPIESIEI